MKMTKVDDLNPTKGFTLLELLIVIAIIAILSAILIFVLNPAEVLKRGRDSQRMSDLKTLNQALAFYITVVSNPDLNEQSEDPLPKKCEDFTDSHIWFSSPEPPSWGYTSGALLTHPDDTSGNWTSGSTYVVFPLISDMYKINGQGWLPVNFAKIASGSPISRLPVDPINKYSGPPFAINYYVGEERGFFYTYTCKEKSTGYKCGALTWELNANLESEEFRTERLTTDGGDRNDIYEIGTCLFLLPTNL